MQRWILKPGKSLRVYLSIVLPFPRVTARSGFIPTANFGLMTAVGLFSGQLFELLLLPALLLLKDGRKKTHKGP